MLRVIDCYNLPTRKFVVPVRPYTETQCLLRARTARTNLRHTLLHLKVPYLQPLWQ